MRETTISPSTTFTPTSSLFSFLADNTITITNEHHDTDTTTPAPTPTRSSLKAPCRSPPEPLVDDTETDEVEHPTPPRRFPRLGRHPPFRAKARCLAASTSQLTTSRDVNDREQTRCSFSVVYERSRGAHNARTNPMFVLRCFKLTRGADERGRTSFVLKLVLPRSFFQPRPTPGLHDGERASTARSSRFRLPP